VTFVFLLQIFVTINWTKAQINVNISFQYILKQWIALKTCADWFIKLQISCAIYLRATRETSEELIQINFLCCILSHCFSIYKNNYSPQCRWLAVVIYLAALRRGKYPPLTTSTSVNSCFCIY